MTPGRPLSGKTFLSDEVVEGLEYPVANISKLFIFVEIS
jgi:hypothetical protein